MASEVQAIERRSFVGNKLEADNRPFCDMPDCKAFFGGGVNGNGYKNKRQTSGRRVADAKLYLLGYPLGSYCNRCVEDLRKAYLRALDG